MLVSVSHWVWWLLHRISAVIANFYTEASPFHLHLFAGLGTTQGGDCDPAAVSRLVCAGGSPFANHPPSTYSLPTSCVLQAQGPFLICGPSWTGNTITFPCSSGQPAARDSPHASTSCLSAPVGSPTHSTSL